MAIESVPTGDPAMTEAEAAKYLRKCPRSLYSLRKTGKIAFIQDGKRIKYRRTELDAYLERLTIPAQEVH